MALSVHSTVEQGTGIVAVAGEIDLATVGGLREAISKHLTEGRAHLVVDLSAVTFIDSTGLGVLVGAAKKVTGAGSVGLVCTEPRVLRLLTVTGLSRVLLVHPTLADALP